MQRLDDGALLAATHTALPRCPIGNSGRNASIVHRINSRRSWRACSKGETSELSSRLDRCKKVALHLEEALRQRWVCGVVAHASGSGGIELVVDARSDDSGGEGGGGGGCAYFPYAYSAGQ